MAMEVLLGRIGWRYGSKDKTNCNMRKDDNDNDKQ
jgi:hypothetical protein